MKNEINIPELLAPCGSPETLGAALQSGADAVYLGGTVLNARMNAKNFTDIQLKDAIKKCHACGVRIYITLNTLVYDKEFDAALRYAALVYEAGADAFITADIGLAVMLKKYIPQAELHASTQTAGHNSDAAVKFAGLGFSRMVCARELSYGDIKKLAERSPIGIEMFIHGAHCASVSGQCLMSAVMGGRSGNRGECAQPCRMQYNGHSPRGHGPYVSYPLSLKDLCLAGHITDIIGSGVAALKIEGRMKSKEYVGAVTAAYRRLLDERRNADKDEINELAKIFSRSGFTDGYFTGKIDGGMLGIRTETDKNASRDVKSTVKAETETYFRKPIVTEISDRSCNLPENKIKTEKSDVKSRRGISARFICAEQIPEKHNFDHVYLPLEKFDGDKADGIVLPPVITDGDMYFVKKSAEAALKRGAKHIYVGNIGHIEFIREYGLTMHGDYRLNIYNNAAFNYYEKYGFYDILLSPELTQAQIRDIGGGKSVIVYGKIPLMTLKKPINTDILKDRTNSVFKIVRECKYDIVYNSVPIYMADRKTELKNSGIYNAHFIFSDETKREAINIINAYESGAPAAGNYRRIKQ